MHYSLKKLIKNMSVHQVVSDLYIFSKKYFNICLMYKVEL